MGYSRGGGGGPNAEALEAKREEKGGGRHRKRGASEYASLGWGQSKDANEAAGSGAGLKDDHGYRRRRCHKFTLVFIV